VTNEEIAVSILTRYGYNIRLDPRNYDEVKSVVIRALDLADEGNHSEGVKCTEPLDGELQAEVKAVIEKKGDKKLE
jgi:hypothetical protein